MKRVWSSMAIAFAMYSKIPMPKTEWNKENMKYIMCFFPLVGAVVGGLIYLFLSIEGLLHMSHVFNTIIIILIPVAVTGGIHLDGLLDTADARSSFGTREKKLEILKDPHTGVFGVITCVVYFFLTFAVWYEVSASQKMVLALSFLLSRSLSGLSVVTFPMSGTNGLAAMFCRESDKKITRCVMLFYIAAIAVCMLLLDWKKGLLCLLGAGLTFLYYRIMSEREFGGITGDLAGYFLQICELIMAFMVIIGERMLISFLAFL